MARSIDSNRPVVLPLHFTRVDGLKLEPSWWPSSSPPPTDTFDETTAKEMVENLNEIYAPAGVQFRYAGLDSKTVSDSTELTPTQEDRDAATEALKAQAGTAAESPAAGLLSSFAELPAAGKRVSETLFNKSYDDVGRNQIEVVVVPDARAVSPGLAPSVALSELTDFGVKQLAQYGREQMEMGDTHLILYGYNTDLAAPHGKAPKGADVGRYPSVLAHEVWTRT